MDNIKFNCPACSQSLEAPPDMAGEQIECPTCEKEITIPTLRTELSQPRPKKQIRLKKNHSLLTTPTQAPTSESKVPCKKCGAMILPTTAKRNRGRCMPCAGYPQSNTSVSTGGNSGPSAAIIAIVVQFVVCVFWVLFIWDADPEGIGKGFWMLMWLGGSVIGYFIGISNTAETVTSTLRNREHQVTGYVETPTGRILEGSHGAGVMLAALWYFCFPYLSLFIATAQ